MLSLLFLSSTPYAADKIKPFSVLERRHRSGQPQARRKSNISGNRTSAAGEPFDPCKNGLPKALCRNCTALFYSPSVFFFSKRDQIFQLLQETGLFRLFLRRHRRLFNLDLRNLHHKLYCIYLGILELTNEGITNSLLRYSSIISSIRSSTSVSMSQVLSRSSVVPSVSSIVPSFSSSVPS